MLPASSGTMLDAYTLAFVGNCPRRRRFFGKSVTSAQNTPNRIQYSGELRRGWVGARRRCKQLRE